MIDPGQATATVTITLSREDATFLRDLMSKRASAIAMGAAGGLVGHTVPHQERWERMGQAERIGEALAAAAPPPAPSDSLELLTNRLKQIGYRQNDPDLAHREDEKSVVTLTREIWNWTGTSNYWHWLRIHPDGQVTTNTLRVDGPMLEAFVAIHEWEQALAAGRSAGEGTSDE